jgi:glycogen synthase
VYVLPAKYEPFGLSALEAALAGCALVLGDIPTLREIWQDAAIYVDTTDAKALADAVNTIIEDDSKRKGLSNKAKARASNFSAETMAENYWQIYRQMVAQNVKQKEKETI